MFHCFWHVIVDSLLHALQYYLACMWALTDRQHFLTVFKKCFGAPLRAIPDIPVLAFLHISGALEVIRSSEWRITRFLGTISPQSLIKSIVNVSFPTTFHLDIYLKALLTIELVTHGTSLSCWSPCSSNVARLLGVYCTVLHRIPLLPLLYPQNCF